MFRPRLAVELLGLDICDIWIFLDIEMDIEMDFFWKGDFGSESIPLKLLIFFLFCGVSRGSTRPATLPAVDWRDTPCPAAHSCRPRRAVPSNLVGTKPLGPLEKRGVTEHPAIQDMDTDF